MKNILFLFLGFLVLLNSCKKDDIDDNNTQTENKVFIANEGAFGNANSSLSLYNAATATIENNVFYNANSRPIGDVLQSIGFANDKIYLLVNASNKIEVAQKNNLKQIKTIENTSLVRYFAQIDNKTALVSSWANGGQVYVLNLEADIISDSISTGKGADKIFIKNNFAYVLNSGGFETDSTISIINLSNMQLEKTLTIGHRPLDMVFDADDNLYILCSGYAIYDDSWQIIGHKKSSLVKLNTLSNTVEESFLLSEKHPEHIEISSDNQTIFIGGGFGFSGIYKTQLNNPQIDSNVLINGDYYGFNYNPASSELYLLESKSFSSSGKMHIYNEQGSKITTKEVGIGPNSAYFE